MYYCIFIVILPFSGASKSITNEETPTSFRLARAGTQWLFKLQSMLSILSHNFSGTGNLNIKIQGFQGLPRSFHRFILLLTNHFYCFLYIQAVPHSKLFDHMAFDHNFSVGQPNNLVYTNELLNLLEDRLDKMVRVYLKYYVIVLMPWMVWIPH